MNPNQRTRRQRCKLKGVHLQLVALILSGENRGAQTGNIAFFELEFLSCMGILVFLLIVEFFKGIVEFCKGVFVISENFKLISMGFPTRSFPIVKFCDSNFQFTFSNKKFTLTQHITSYFFYQNQITQHLSFTLNIFQKVPILSNFSHI
jgi:hypothetical protein